MKKIEMFVAVALVIAVVGVVLFWVAGFCGYTMISQWSLFIAGVSCWGALAGICLRRLRRRNFCY